MSETSGSTLRSPSARYAARIASTLTFPRYHLGLSELLGPRRSRGDRSFGLTMDARLEAAHETP